MKDQIKLFAATLLLAWGVAMLCDNLGLEPIHDSVEPIRKAIVTLGWSK